MMMKKLYYLLILSPLLLGLSLARAQTSMTDGGTSSVVINGSNTTEVIYDDGGNGGDGGPYNSATNTDVLELTTVLGAQIELNPTNPTTEWSLGFNATSGSVLNIYKGTGGSKVLWHSVQGDGTNDPTASQPFPSDDSASSWTLEHVNSLAFGFRGFELTATYVPPAATADYTVSSLVLSGFSGTCGTDMDLAVDQNRSGTGGGSAVDLGYYFSTDATWDAGDQLLATDQSDLSSATSESEAATVTIPSGLATGTYYIIAKADHTDLETETDEGNNEIATSFTVSTCFFIPTTISPGTYTLDCSAGSSTFYDDGGTGSYSPNQNTEMTITPSDASQYLMVEVLSELSAASINIGDTLLVYNGVGTSGPIIRKFDFLSHVTQDTFTALNPGDALTFVWKTDGVGEDDGFEATVSCASSIDYSRTFVDGGGITIDCGTAYRFFDQSAEGFYVSYPFEETFWVYPEDNTKYMHLIVESIEAQHNADPNDGTGDAKVEIWMGIPDQAGSVQILELSEFLYGTQSTEADKMKIALPNPGEPIGVKFSGVNKGKQGLDFRFECADLPDPNILLNSGTANPFYVDCATNQVFDFHDIRPTVNPQGYYPEYQNATFNHVFSVKPQDPSKYVVVEFNSIDMRNGDSLFIYDGMDTTAPLLRQFPTGANFGPRILNNSSQAGGGITMQFKTNGDNFNAPGWEGSIYCSDVQLTNEMRNGQYTVDCGQTYKLYDHGGPNGNASHDVDLVLTLYPDDPGRYLQIDIDTVHINPGVSLKIYQGEDTTGTPMASLESIYQEPSSLFFGNTQPGEAITLFWDGNGSTGGTSKGWDFEITCVDTLPLNNFASNVTYHMPCDGTFRFTDDGGPSGFYNDVKARRDSTTYIPNPGNTLGYSFNADINLMTTPSDDSLLIYANSTLIQSFGGGLHDQATANAAITPPGEGDTLRFLFIRNGDNNALDGFDITITNTETNASLNAPDAGNDINSLTFCQAVVLDAQSSPCSPPAGYPVWSYESGPNSPGSVSFSSPSSQTSSVLGLQEGNHTLRWSHNAGIFDEMTVTIPPGAGSPSNDLTWTGAESTNWFDCANWSANDGGYARVPDQNCTVSIPDGSNECHISLGTGVVEDITIEPTGSLVIYSMGNLNVYGDFLDNGSFLHTSGEVSFLGSGNRNLGGSSVPDFRQLTVNLDTVTDTLHLTGDAEVWATFVPTNGIIKTDTSSRLIIKDNATSSPASDTSHVVGPLRKIGNDDFVFPIGGNGRAAQVGIESLSSTGSYYFDAEYFPEPHPDTGSAFMTAPIEHVSYLEYWNIDRSHDNQAFVRLYWNSTASGINNPLLANDLSIAHHNGAMWEEVASTVDGASTSASGSVVSNALVNDFSPFTFSSRTLGMDNPLPLQLLYFIGERKDHKAQLEWALAKSGQNGKLYLERATGEQDNFERLAAFDLNQTQLKMRFTDPFLEENKDYRYRLVLNDEGQAPDTSQTLYLNSKGKNQAVSFEAWPNPAQEVLRIELEGLQAPMTVEILSPSGNVVKTQTLRNGSNWLEVGDLPQGLYFIIGEDLPAIQKFIKG